MNLRAAIERSYTISTGRQHARRRPDGQWSETLAWHEERHDCRNDVERSCPRRNGKLKTQWRTLVSGRNDYVAMAGSARCGADVDGRDDGHSANGGTRVVTRWSRPLTTARAGGRSSTRRAPFAPSLKTETGRGGREDGVAVKRRGTAVRGKMSARDVAGKNGDRAGNLNNGKDARAAESSTCAHGWSCS